MVMADAMPEISGAVYFLSEEPRGSQSVHRAVGHDCDRSEADFGKVIKMTGIDLEWPQIPCAVRIAQCLAQPTVFGCEYAKQRRKRHLISACGIDNGFKSQGTDYRQRHFCALCSLNRRSQQAYCE